MLWELHVGRKHGHESVFLICLGSFMCHVSMNRRALTFVTTRSGNFRAMQKDRSGQWRTSGRLRGRSRGPAIWVPSSTVHCSGAQACRRGSYVLFSRCLWALALRQCRSDSRHQKARLHGKQHHFQESTVTRTRVHDDQRRRPSPLHADAWVIRTQQRIISP